MLEIQFKMKTRTKRRICKYVAAPLGASVLRNMLAVKGVIPAGEWTTRADQNF